MHFLEQYTWRLCWLKKIIVLRAYAPGPAMVVAKNFIMKKTGAKGLAVGALIGWSRPNVLKIYCKPAYSGQCELAFFRRHDRHLFREWHSQFLCGIPA